MKAIVALQQKQAREAAAFVRCAVQNKEELKRQLEQARQKSESVFQAMVRRFTSWGTVSPSIPQIKTFPGDFNSYDPVPAAPSRFSREKLMAL